MIRLNAKIEREERWTKVSEEIARRVVQHAVLPIAAKVEETAKRLCPFDTGTLRSSIHLEYHGGMTAYVVAGGPSARYARFVEEGHWQVSWRGRGASKTKVLGRWVAGRPYLRPAVQRHRREWQRRLKEAIYG